MSLRATLDRLDKTLPGGDNCPICGRPHLRNVAQFVVWYYDQPQEVINVGHDPGEYYCNCGPCGCADMNQAMHAWKSGARLEENS